MTGSISKEYAVTVSVLVGMLGYIAYKIEALEQAAISRPHVEYTMLCRVHKDSNSKNFLVLECVPHTTEKARKDEFDHRIKTNL